MIPASASPLVVFALGGNLGDPVAVLRAAAHCLAAVLETATVSGVYRTPPEAGDAQPAYLNAAVAGATGMSAREALALAQALEAEAGRERPYAGAPRTLDVDVVFLGDSVVDEPDLRIPHPRWMGRDFVVVPLMDIVPDFRDPESGRTVREVALAAGWLDGRFPLALEPGMLLASEAG